MTKTEYLARSAPFIHWLATVVSGQTPLGYRHDNGVDANLNDALDRYSWPNKRIDIPTPDGQLSIPAHSNFLVNAILLERLQAGLRRSLDQTKVDDAELAHWAEAIMRWGGVFTKRGNGPWLDSKRVGFSTYLRPVLQALSDPGGSAHKALPDLRSNAGTTKIHSLALPDFVIYDSRVAAALAWLALRWSQQEGIAVPAHLRFACMRANTSKTNLKMRSPDQAIFPYFAASGPLREHQRHATWNMRANWIICAAAAQCPAGAWTARQIEAALFMMGADLTSAMRGH